MRRATAFLALALTVLAGSTLTAKAASLTVSPILLDGAADNQVITLRNAEARPLTAQIRVFRWTQEDGEDQLTPTDDVVVSPPIVTIRANEDYVVRLQRASGEARSTREEAYRVVIDQLPDPNRQRNGTVALVLRYLVPAFFSSPDAGQPRVSWRLSSQGGHGMLVATNDGDKRLQVTDLSLRSGGRTVPLRKGLAGYVLAHSVKTFALTGKVGPLRGATVTAGSEHGPINVPLVP